MTSREKSNLNLWRGNPNSPMLDSERASEIGKMGAAKSHQVQRERKTIAEYLSMWLDSSLSNQDKIKLEELGLQNIDEKKALLIIPLIKNLNKGDIKTYQLVLSIIGEDKKREEEIAKLKLENEILKQQLSGEGVDKVEIIMDLPKEEQQ